MIKKRPLRDSAKAAKNGKNKKVYCLNSRGTDISLRALRRCEKMLCFVPVCPGLNKSSYIIAGKCLIDNHNLIHVMTNLPTLKGARMEALN